ncbi:MAG: hypothetical protein JXJ18_11870 [Rhodobacteraceae bacterium]|nr:hypothetical protein [Paracoccaceae bacterium]
MPKALVLSRPSRFSRISTRLFLLKAQLRPIGVDGHQWTMTQAPIVAIPKAANLSVTQGDDGVRGRADRTTAREIEALSDPPWDSFQTGGAKARGIDRGIAAAIVGM